MKCRGRTRSPKIEPKTTKKGELKIRVGEACCSNEESLSRCHYLASEATRRKGGGIAFQKENGTAEKRLEKASHPQKWGTRSGNSAQRRIQRRKHPQGSRDELRWQKRRGNLQEGRDERIQSIGTGRSLVSRNNRRETADHSLLSKLVGIAAAAKSRDLKKYRKRGELGPCLK